MKTTHRMKRGAAPHPACRAIVIVPACNEEETLAATLDALRSQIELAGTPMVHDRYEVHVLLNNCTDASEAVATAYRALYPGFHLGVHVCTLQEEEAHVGTARSMLMEFACSRLEIRGGIGMAILSTDADTRVAPDWVAQNLAEIADGADVVGGLICVAPEDLAKLNAGTQRAYQRDCLLQRLVARLESALDPDPADPWPRHLHHFGASLACTAAIYRKSGGMPPVKPLEDVAFVDALRKVDARIRHAPNVKIVTSARLDGRAVVGLSGQLRRWSEDEARGTPQMVDSAEWLEHRFRSLGNVRSFYRGASLTGFPTEWHERLLRVRGMGLPAAAFLEVLDCDALIQAMFESLDGQPARHDEISRVIERLEAKLTTLPNAP